MIKTHLLNRYKSFFSTNYDISGVQSKAVPFAGTKLHHSQCLPSRRVGKVGIFTYYNLQQCPYWKVGNAIEAMLAAVDPALSVKIVAAANECLGILNTATTAEVYRKISTENTDAGIHILMHRITSWLGTDVVVEMVYATGDMAHEILSTPTELVPAGTSHPIDPHLDGTNVI